MSKLQTDTAAALILALQRKCDDQAKQLQYQAEQLEIARQLVYDFSLCANCGDFIPKMPEGESGERWLCNMACTICYFRHWNKGAAGRISYCEKCITHCLHYLCQHRKVCEKHLPETSPCFECREGYPYP